MTLMDRRRALMTQNGAEPKNGFVVGGSGNLTAIGRNRLQLTYWRRWQWADCSIVDPIDVDPGDVIDLRLIYVSGDGYMMRDTSSRLGGITMQHITGAASSIADLSGTITVTEATQLTTLGLTGGGEYYRPTQPLVFDAEVYVNGKRVI